MFVASFLILSLGFLRMLEIVRKGFMSDLDVEASKNFGNFGQSPTSLKNLKTNRTCLP